MRIQGVNWAGVKTNSFESMKQFAERTLGLTAAYAAPDFVAYLLPNGDKFEVFGPGFPNPAEQFERNEVVCGFRVDDIDQAREELKSAGIELIGPVKRERPGGYAWQHFRMPDGKVFELCYEPAT
jgi:predicted enzyme related to lactoylglutathione lyase